MTVQKGDRIPNAEVFVLGGDGPETVNTEILFSNKKIVLFALTGAFTKTCSIEHLPGFLDNADNFFIVSQQGTS
mgnify:CR=1 FL=1